MGNWKVLKIDPTTDQRKIKKAYAKLLKIYHPEDDPEGYQRLREAYDYALTAAKEESASTQTEQDASNGLVVEAQVAVKTKDPVATFMDEVDKLYQDFFARIDVNRWTELFSNDILWDLEKTEAIQASLIDYVEDNYFIPHSVWQLFDKIFHWSERKEEMVAQYGEEIYIRLVGRIKGVSTLSYDYFEPTAHVDFERFLYLREEAQHALGADELERAEIAIEEALKIYAKDPSILRLQVNYFQRLENDEAALKGLASILAINPTDEDAHINRLAIHYHNERYEQTITEGEQFLQIQPDQEEAKIFVIKSYARLGDSERGTTLAKELWGDNPYDIEFFLKRSSDMIKNISKTEMKELRKQSRKKHHLLGIIVFFTIVFLRRMWVYIIPFLLIGLLTPLPFKYAIWAISVLGLWEMWKIQKTMRL